MGTAPAGQEVGEDALERHWRRAHAEDTALAAAERSRPLAERLGAREEIAPAREQVFPLSREVNAAADPVEQPNAELALQLADLTPQGGLTDVQPSGRLREATGVGDRDEVPEVPEIHGDRIPSGYRL